MRLRSLRVLLVVAAGLVGVALLPGLAVAAPSANDAFAAPQELAATTTDTTVEPGEEGYFSSPNDATRAGASPTGAGLS